ncbi:MAG: hypothetical protein ACREPR_12290 [Brasilonema sp.]
MPVLSGLITGAADTARWRMRKQNQRRSPLRWSPLNKHIRIAIMVVHVKATSES